MTNSFILGARRYRVVAPVTVITLSSGTEAYVYRDGILPGNADPNHVELLLERGHIVEMGRAV